jgi:hypothetical protein
MTKNQTDEGASAGVADDFIDDVCHSACNIGSDSLLMQFGKCLAF